MENNKVKHKVLSIRKNGFYERINDSNGFEINGLKTNEEKEKKLQELMKKAKETYDNIQKEKENRP